jgi:hypothetical protein
MYYDQLMPRARYATNLREPFIDPLENIVAGLNEAEPRLPEQQRFLRELVGKWNSCDRSYESLLKREPAVAAILNRTQWTTRLFPAPTGGASLWVAPSLRQPEPEPGRDFALQLFVNFLTHRSCQRLGGPCPRCGRYYIRRTVRQRVYCSRKCAKDTTAVAATTKRLQAKKAADLQCAANAVAEWETTRRRQDWKRFVKARCRLSFHFLTRAVNEGTLQPPARPDRRPSKPGSGKTGKTS